MSKRKPPSDIGESIRAVFDRYERERFNLLHAAALLKMLAEDCQEGRHDDPAGAWLTAEYLADAMAGHADKLLRIGVDLDRLAMASNRPPPPDLHLVPDGGAA